MRATIYVLIGIVYISSFINTSCSDDSSTDENICISEAYAKYEKQLIKIADEGTFGGVISPEQMLERKKRAENVLQSDLAKCN